MNLATSAIYFAYQTISSGFLILYRHTLTQTCVIEVLTPKYLRSDHYPMRGPIFSENNSPPDQNFRRTKIFVTVVQHKKLNTKQYSLA